MNLFLNVKSEFINHFFVPNSLLDIEKVHKIKKYKI